MDPTRALKSSLSCVIQERKSRFGVPLLKRVVARDKDESHQYICRGRSL